MISYGKREVRYQVGLEPHKIHTKCHKNVSADFQVEVGVHTQRRGVNPLNTELNPICQYYK